MTSWDSAFCHTNAIDIHYLRTGGAKHPLLLLHGLTGSAACWTPFARALESDYDVVMPDARGHGSSSAPSHGYTYDDHAADAAGLIRELGLSTPILLGHSMGGMTAALVANDPCSAIRALILVDPTFLSPPHQREVYESDVALQHRQLLSLDKPAVVAQIRQRHPQRSPELVGLLAEARLHTRPGAFDVLKPPNPSYRRLIRAVQVSILLVIGDCAKGAVVSQETARRLRGINPRLQVAHIPCAGHAIPYDQPERLEAAVMPFLRSIDY
jgi:N-formylmaleamate deformylase